MFRAFAVLSCLLLSTGCVPKKNSEVKSQEKSSIHLGPNDVSILFPFIEQDPILKKLPMIKDAGGSESFLPNGLLSALDKSLIDDWVLRAETEKGAFTDVLGRKQEKFFQTAAPFQLVALRIDPCANVLTTKGDDNLCLRQLRLIWQPKIDAAIHTIYTLDKATFTELLKQMDEVRKNATQITVTDALESQPVMRAEGDGPYFKGLMAVLEKFAKASLLTQVAAHGDTLDGRPSLWRFVGMSVENGQYKVLPLKSVKTMPGETPKSVQMVPEFFDISGSGNRSLPWPFLNPPWPLGDHAHRFSLDDSSRIPTLEEAIKHIANNNAVQNPLMHDIFNTDCVSCHAANGGEGNTMRLPWRTMEDERNKNINTYKNANFPLQLRDEYTNSDSRNIHNFGHFQWNYSISNRTANETAEVLEYLKLHYGNQ